MKKVDKQSRGYGCAARLSMTFGSIRASSMLVVESLFGTTMKPTKAQFFFASPWPARIWFTALPLLLAFTVGQTCSSFLEPLASWRDAVWFAWFVLLALFLGFTLAIFPGWFIIGPLFYDREMKNGGPFKVGDTVRILSGPQKGRISRVYATWQGNLLRVELDEKATEDFSDVFSPMELLREESAQQDAES